MEAPCDQEGEGLGEGLGEGEGDADGAGDCDTGPAQGEHQGWRWRVPPLKVQSVKQLGDKSRSPITESKDGTVPTKLLSCTWRTLQNPHTRDQGTASPTYIRHTPLMHQRHVR
jgi:hypothetical protein